MTNLDLFNMGFEDEMYYFHPIRSEPAYLSGFAMALASGKYHQSGINCIRQCGGGV